MNKKKTILFIIDGLGSGGKERQLVEILKYLSKNERFKIGVVTFNSSKHYSVVVRELAAYFKELSKRPVRLEPLFTIWKCFQDFKPDIVYTWDNLSHFYSYLPSKYYGTRVINGSIRNTVRRKGWKNALDRFFLKQSDLIIANSNAGLQAYRVNGVVIYNAIDRNRFLRQKYGGEYNLAMTANFTNTKDHQTFLDAAAILIRKKIADKIFLIGDGPYKKKYENRVANRFSDIRGHFLFTGTISNVEEYLARCRIGVLCSTLTYGEGASNSVLEYMAAGLIAIVTDIGASSEIIEHGKNGFLIKPGGVDEIVRIVKAVKSDNSLADRLRANAEVTIEQKFDYQKNVRMLEDVFLHIAKVSYG